MQRLQGVESTIGLIGKPRNPERRRGGLMIASGQQPVRRRRRRMLMKPCTTRRAPKSLRKRHRSPVMMLDLALPFGASAATS